MTRAGVKIDLDTGDLVSSAGRAKQSIADLNAEMKKAGQDGRWDDYTQLAVAKDRLQAKTGGFEKDIKTLTNDPRFQATTSTGGTVFKMDSEYASLIKSQIEAMNKLAAEYEEAIRSGDVGKIKELTPQIEKQQSEFHKTVEDATAQPGAKPGAGAVAGDALAKIFSAQMLMGAITNGVNMYVAHLDRSGIVGRMGSGDVIGAQIEELHRGAAETSAKGGFGGNIIGGLLGGAAGFVLSGFNPAGAIAGVGIGQTIGGGLGGLLGIGKEAEANKKSTDEAYARQWEEQAPGAMEMTALLGGYGGTVEENTRSLRTAFDRAARAANEFGYSAEEGVEAVKQAVAQGMSQQEAIEAAKNVFNFERGTGAERGTLTQIENQMRRFGGQQDALGVAWQGNQASGMATGQYSEFLRSMQRIFEDGIGKGFVRGAKEISGSLTWLADLSGGSELWKGEQGEKRLSQMNAGLESATNLASVTDVLALRGAQNVLKGFKEEDWNKLLNVDKSKDGSEDIRRGTGSDDYINAMILLERGLTPELFKAQMGMMETAEVGSRSGTIERMRQMYGFNYTESAQLYDMYKDKGADLSTKEIEDALEKYAAAPPKHSTQEEEMFKNIGTIETKVSEIGIYYHDKKAPEIQPIVTQSSQQAAEAATGIKPYEEEPAYYPPTLPQATIKDLMGGMETMPMYNTPSGIPGPSFKDRMETAKNAPKDSAEHQAYIGLQRHFSSLMANDIENARQHEYYPRVWQEAQGDPVRIMDIIGFRAAPVNRDQALEGFFDQRGDSGVLKAIGSFLHLFKNDNTARDRLDELESNTRIDSPDYDYLMRAYAQLSRFNPQQRETVDLDNSLNKILQDNNLTAQKLYESVVELAKSMDVNIMYE